MFSVLLSRMAGIPLDDPILDPNPTTWDITTLLSNLTETLKNWGGMVIIMLGVVMIIVAVWKAATGLISHGKTQTNWFVVAALLIFGGALAVGGWNWVYGLSKGGQTTLNNLANGTYEGESVGQSGNFNPSSIIAFSSDYLKSAIAARLG